MATKKISELTQVNSVSDTDLLLVETPEGTKAVAKGTIISESDRTNWNNKADAEELNAIKPKVGSVTLDSSAWETANNGESYVQVRYDIVVTPKSKIDLQPDTGVLSQLVADGIWALYAANWTSSEMEKDRQINFVALGGKPSVNLTIQYTITEVGS